MSTLKTNKLVHTANGASEFTLPQTDGSAGQILKTDGSGNLSWTTPSKILQVVNTQTGAMSTGTTTIPHDNTIPQITEGFEVMTRTITPTNASNTLLINVVCHLSASTNSIPTTALFVGTTADALACTFSHAFGAGDYPKVHNFTHKMTAGVTSELTFRVRTGSNNSGTTTFNGREQAGSRGGVLASSITIMEVAV